MTSAMLSSYLKDLPSCWLYLYLLQAYHASCRTTETYCALRVSLPLWGTGESTSSGKNGIREKGMILLSMQYFLFRPYSIRRVTYHLNELL